MRSAWLGTKLKNMREIKFRAWDESQKYMAYQGTPDLETLQSFMHHFGDQYLMQFTGLYDKNGNEIYEGDIIKGETRNFTVKFEEGMFTTDVGKYILNGDYEIIGNIHQNPELLESSAKADA